MIEDLIFSDGYHNEFSAWRSEDRFVVAVYNDYESSMGLTKEQALRLAEYIGEVFCD